MPTNTDDLGAMGSPDRQGTVVISALLPHPPIVVPAVGGRRTDECGATYRACTRLAARVVASRPHHLLLPSPHAPRDRRAFGIWRRPVRGDLRKFGAPGAQVVLDDDPDMATALATAARAEGLATWDLPPSEPLDHGAIVPLHFLCAAGWSGPTTIVSLPWSRDPEVFAAFGRAVATAAPQLDGATAVVASGDMSHRVLPEAPAGYHPRAIEFDRQLVALIRDGALRRMTQIDPELRELAAEDAADTSILAAAAAGWRDEGHEVLSYEHPFGVGYLVAVFHDAAARDFG